MDFIYFRTNTLTFLPGQTSMRISTVILEDETPEDTEVFSVELREPRGGAEIGPNRRVTISILSNDNAHGVLGFTEVYYYIYLCSCIMRMFYCVPKPHFHMDIVNQMMLIVLFRLDKYCI